MLKWLKLLLARFFKKKKRDLPDYIELSKKQPESTMTSIRPYLIRAFYDWISDNNCTPHLIIDATIKGVVVPREYVTNGQIILDIASDAVDNLEITATSVSFEAAFGAEESVAIFLPIRSVLAIYSLENDEGMSFVDNNNEQEWNESDEDSTTSLSIKKRKREQSDKKSGEKSSHLTVIK
ncbi:ClpXP protease specificity-enhancing factor [bacterium]|jgi:stringent starvation protein B|nr:ClpXP protease specificity-enhancing factor [bacterium]NBX72290.1 ClpXP protease specificity-enhancing factor [bacterium]